MRLRRPSSPSPVDDKHETATPTTATIVEETDASLATPHATTLAWDDEAHASAWEQVDAVSDRDSDAALYLHQVALVQSAASIEPEIVDDHSQPSPVDAPASSPRLLRLRPRADAFDVMRFFEAIAAEYHWSHEQIMGVPWKTLLGYAREAELRHEREERAIRDAQRANNGGALPSGDGDVDALVAQDEARVQRLLAQGAPLRYEQWARSDAS